MSEEVPETADGAIRGWMVAVGFTLVLTGGELMTEKDGVRFGTGVLLAVAGLPCYLSAYWWKALKPKLPERFLATLNGVATDARWWAGGLLIFLTALLLSPGIGNLLRSQTWLPSENSGRIQSLEKQLDGLRSDLVAAHEQIASLQTGQTNKTAAPPTTIEPEAGLSSADRATKLEIWHSVHDHINGFVNAYNDLDVALRNWRGNVKDNKNNLTSKLTSSKEALRSASERLEKLRAEYVSYNDIANVIHQQYTHPKLKSIFELVRALNALSDKLPADYEVIINPYVGNVRVEATHLANWMTDVQRMADIKVTQLSGRR
jgi:hypothetical protein